MRKIKSGSPFLRGVKPWQGRRARVQKSQLRKHHLAPPSLKRTMRLFAAQGESYHPGTIRNASRYLHASRTEPKA